MDNPSDEFGTPTDLVDASDGDDSTGHNDEEDEDEDTDESKGESTKTKSMDEIGIEVKTDTHGESTNGTSTRAF